MTQPKNYWLANQVEQSQLHRFLDGLQETAFTNRRDLGSAYSRADLRNAYENRTFSTWTL